MNLTLRNSTYPELRDPFELARSLFGWDPVRTGTNGKATFAANFEVKETPESFVVVGDFPGVKEEDIELALNRDVLTISGNRNAEKKQEGDTYYVYERQYGTFTRSFRLPENADGEKIAAELTDGVLTVSIPKKEAAKPRKIPFLKK
jgi:HSP20 family protein